MTRSGDGSTAGPAGGGSAPSAALFAGKIRESVASVIVGQEVLVDRLLVGILCGGHVLLEGVPGLAKSLAVQTLARSIDATFRRIQFTPDLLPADLIGTRVFDRETGRFQVRRGPLFANVVLADEINRAPAKVQSALLEAMQERQTTIGDETFPLPEPFLVFATQNPIEQEGTYPLPEAQADRFLLKVKVPYPSREEEERIVERMARTGPSPAVEAVASAEEILAARAELDAVYVDEKIRRYVVDVVFATRDPAAAGLPDLEPLVAYGASPRASIALVLCAKAAALLDGRDYVTPRDVKSVGMDVLRHRVIVSFEGEAEGFEAEGIVSRVFEVVEVP